ncbi:MerR family transcriptional regulator [Bacillus sp. AGMB 02131]|uniref:MerR family transcriptional regulator n=1 Tax=Peribacillus faecalis TaxID=2772559 RepID=A0A927D1Y7_9BACI|nr:MerR family transcriptional regulator [Peribacillus faecalis]MBD3110080.1 MerR family transcriptional regulator [Peribacillus faecalis]
MKYFSIGEVSKKFNTSLRTLRYYDEINLLQPEVKDESGRRFYSQDNLLTLEKITLLKSASLPLSDIQNILNEADMHAVLLLHKNLLQKEIQQLQQSLAHTQSLLHILFLEEELNWEQLLPLVRQNEMMNKEKKLVTDDFFNKQEQLTLKEVLPHLENDNPETIKWLHIMKRIQLYAEKKLPPHSKEAQLLAADIQLLTLETFDGDEELAERFWKARKSEEQSEAMNLYPIDQELLDYVEEITSVYENMNRQPKRRRN